MAQHLAQIFAQIELPPRLVGLLFMSLALAILAVCVVLCHSAQKKFSEKEDQTGKCPRCRYDLTGNLTGQCPECGTLIDGESFLPPVE